MPSMNAWTFGGSTFPHSDELGWQEICSPQATPWLDFLRPLDDRNSKDHVSLGSLKSTSDISGDGLDDVARREASSSLGLDGSACHTKPICLGLSPDILTSCQLIQVVQQRAKDGAASDGREMPPAIEDCNFAVLLSGHDLLMLLSGFLSRLKDVASLRVSSSRLCTPVTQMINSSQRLWFIPLHLRYRAEEYVLLKGNVEHQRLIMGKTRNRVAALLGPKMWGNGLAPRVHVMLEVEVFRPTCGFALGMVPDNEFFVDPRGSPTNAFLIDHLARSHSQGHLEILPGIHIAEGDSLSLMVEPMGNQVKVSFAQNDSPLQGMSFNILRSKRYSPVVFFDVCQPGNAPTQLRLPLQMCSSLTSWDRAVKLILKGLGAGLLDLKLSPHVVAHLTVQDLRQRIADHYKATQVQIWLGAFRLEDSCTPLVQLVQSQLKVEPHIKMLVQVSVLSTRVDALHGR